MKSTSSRTFKLEALFQNPPGFKKPSTSTVIFPFRIKTVNNNHERCPRIFSSRTLIIVGDDCVHLQRRRKNPPRACSYQLTGRRIVEGIKHDRNRRNNFIFLNFRCSTSTSSMVSFLKHLRIDHGDMPRCDRTPPMTPKTPMSPPRTPCSPFVLNATSFCFRKGPARSVVYQPSGHPKQAVIDGEIWPPIFKPKNVRSAKMMQINDNDVVIATYPKCGTTWLQHITSQLVRGVDYKATKGNELCLQSPMIERMGAQFANTIQGPRVLKTHFDHVNIPRSQTAKYIYCVRNPKDCLTSYFHHNRNFKIYNWEHGTWNVFVDLFASGKLAFGDYFDHLLSWISHIDDENVLFLKYEDMVEDLEGSILKIGQFLGGEAAMRVQDYRSLREIVENSTIDAMKKDQKRWFPENILHKAEFIRKGGSRDWKNHFTREQSDRIDSIFQQKFAGTVVESWWRQEMAWDDGKVGSMDNLSMYSGGEDEQRGFSGTGKLFALPPLSQRRYSRASLLSSGYGSVWSLASAAKLD